MCLQDWYTIDWTKIQFLVQFGMNPVIPIPQPYTGGPNGRRRLLQASDADISPRTVDKTTSTPPDLSQNPGIQVYYVCTPGQIIELHGKPNKPASISNVCI